MKIGRLINGFMLLIVLGIFSCSKESPQDNNGSVLFKFDGLIDSNIIMEAGEHNYVMHTEYSDKGNNDVLLMRGEFRNKSNTTDNYLRFEFYGYDSASNVGVLQNVFNELDYYSYSTDSIMQTITGATLKFNALYGTGALVNWDFGDGSTGSGDSVTHTFQANTSDAMVSMSTYYNQVSCGDSVSNLINLLDPVNSQVQFDVNALNQNLDSFSFNASAGFTSYSWDFGNQTNQSGANPFAQVSYSDSTKKTIVLVASKPSATSTWKAVLTPNSVYCFAAYVYSVLSTPTVVNATRAPYKTCVITYKKDGVVYSSYKPNNSNQSGRKVFTLNRAKNYINNPAGESTIHLRGSVNTYLFNVNNVNDSIPIISSNVSIAVAHP